MGKKQDYIASIIPTLLPMDIIATRDRSPVSWWIRQQTSSKWSHVFLAGEQGYGYTTALFFERVSLVSYLNDKSFVVLRMNRLEDIQHNRGLEACRAELGCLYPIWNILLMLAKNELDPGAPKVALPGQRAKICSQFVAWLYQVRLCVPLLGWLKLDWSMFTPQRCVEDYRLQQVAIWED